MDNGQASAQHTYTYLFCDLLTDQLLAELPMAGVTYGYTLNGIGTLRGTVPFSDDTLPLDPLNATTPSRTAVYVDRDGVLVWGGILWTREDVAGGKSIQCMEFPSYFQHRYVKLTLSTDTSMITNPAYVGSAPGAQRLYADQKYIVWSLLRYARDQAGGNIGLGLDVLATNPHGITRNVTYAGYERPEIYKAISELAAADDGFDFGMELGWTQATASQPPTRYKRLVTYFPRKGRSQADTGFAFSKGGAAGNILSYNWPDDGTNLVTEMSGLGAGTGEARIVKTASDTDAIASGWPLLEGVATYDGVTDEAQVQGLTTADLEARSSTQPTFEVLADADPEFGSYTVGDEALFVIDPEPQSPYGRRSVLRIINIENTASRGPERVRLTCVGA